MKNINFKIKGQIPKNTIIHIDGKIVKFKKNKNNNLVYTHQTESAKTTITMVRYLELNVKHWFFWQMLLFFASIFGIFDQRADKKCMTLEVKLDVFHEGDANVELRFNKQLDGKPAVDVVSEANVFEAKNVYIVDKNCKKKLKKLKTAKIITTVLVLALAIALLVMLLPK